MFVLNNLKMPYKYTSVTADDDCICVRIFSPLVCRAAEKFAGLEQVVSTNSVKGKLLILDGGAEIVCTHEIHVNRSSELWAGGNHLVFYTTPDLYVSNVIAVSRKEDLIHIPAITVLAEVLCASKDQKCRDSDFNVNADPKGLLLTNLDQTESKVTFGFSTKIDAPETVKTNSLFSVFLSMTDCSGNPVNGHVIAEPLSGYIPNRVVNIVNGTASFICSSLLVNDEVIIKVCGLNFSVGVKDE